METTSALPRPLALLAENGPEFTSRRLEACDVSVMAEWAYRRGVGFTSPTGEPTQTRSSNAAKTGESTTTKAVHTTRWGT